MAHSESDIFATNYIFGHFAATNEWNELSQWIYYICEMKTKDAIEPFWLVKVCEFVWAKKLPLPKILNIELKNVWPYEEKNINGFPWKFQNFDR